jgi:hypothetical protein
MKIVKVADTCKFKIFPYLCSPNQKPDLYLQIIENQIK